MENNNSTPKDTNRQPNQERQRKNQQNRGFSKYLVMKHKDQYRKLTKTVNPIVIDKAIKHLLGKSHKCVIKPTRPGHFLIEAD